jgi:osmotically-inducible protein OsmY
MSEEPHYVVARIRERLAQDPEAAELSVQVTVRREEVYLAGAVTDDAHRAAICRVVRDAAPTLRVHDEMHTVSTDAPIRREELA